VSRFGPDVTLNSPAFIHPTAVIHGRVTLEDGASLWPYAVIRAECEEVRVGRNSNLQDFVMIHTAPGFPTLIGEYCSITHHVTLHCCRIADNCLIGINATIMDGAVIGENSIVGANAIVTEGTVIEPNSIVAGIPAKVIRQRNNFIPNRVNAEMYLRNAKAYARGEHRTWTGPDFERFTRETVVRVQRQFETLYGPAADAP